MKPSPMDEYRALMEEIESPSTVHESILSEIEHTRREERRKGRAPHARRAGVRGDTAEEARDGATAAVVRRCRWRPVIAGACALAVVAALVPFSGQLAGLPGDMGGHGSAVAGQAFSVRAYASDTRMLVPPTDNGMIVFDRSGSLTTPTKDWYLQYGKYTGCMFTVEGEGIVRIQATTSAGMFYRNSYETIILSAWPRSLHGNRRRRAWAIITESTRACKWSTDLACPIPIVT